MYCQISKIILWPRVAASPPRVVPFRTGALNVISGGSKTGKSAIIPIIDYCLGAEKCAIPVQTIRHACSWFGVVLATTRGELLLARREPGAQKSTGDMFVLEGRSVEVPDTIESANSNVEQAKELLNELAGLTRLSVDVDRSGGPSRGRPSFRDMMAFTFQPQHIVANPNVLFFKADTTEHREKLKGIFPYVLGAVTAEGLALQHERQRLVLELRRKERELEGVRSLSERWIAEIAGDVARARELNLLRESLPREASPDAMIGALRAVVAQAEHEPLLSAAGIEAVTGEMAELQAEESSVSLALAGLRRRLTAMKDFNQTSGTYQETLAIRRDRLGVANWIGDLFAESHECPMCGTTDRPAEVAVRRLQGALEEVEAQTDAFARVPAAFDREHLRVQADVDRATERLNGIRLRRRALEMSSETARRRQYDVTAAARFLGHLEDALTRYDQIATDGDLAAEVAVLRERLEAIVARLSALGEAGALRRASAGFTALAGRIVPELDAERPNDPIELDLGELTVRVIGRHREDYLWEVGSGANWLTYHIATSVALHELFLALPASPVPGFVVYDQPSQVYFPRSVGRERDGTRSDADSEEGASGALESESPAQRQRPADEQSREAARQAAGAHPGVAVPNSGEDAAGAADPDGSGASRVEKAGDDADEAQVSDEDVEAVRRVFATLAEATRRMRGRWQAIVLDHARDDVWGSVPDVHLVQEWRDGVKLVPVEWLDEANA
jgi:hypothetical protein